MDKHILPSPISAPIPSLAPPPSWRDALPVLETPRVVLRELRQGDAATLLPAITAPEVARFISPPPPSVEQFEWFIDWSHRERLAGRYAGFAMVPRGTTEPVGLLQVRQLDPAFHTAEWGFALGTSAWGTGLFGEAAREALAFVFDVLQVQRLEARAAVPNARAHAVLRRLGAVQEGVLRGALVTATGEQFDQLLWAILATQWRSALSTPVVRVH
jgi:[ribosomal protein S5]-alanine N-acetyltransferase